MMLGWRRICRFCKSQKRIYKLLEVFDDLAESTSVPRGSIDLSVKNAALSCLLCNSALHFSEFIENFGLYRTWLKAFF